MAVPPRLRTTCAMASKSTINEKQPVWVTMLGPASPNSSRRCAHPLSATSARTGAAAASVASRSRQASAAVGSTTMVASSDSAYRASTALLSALPVGPTGSGTVPGEAQALEGPGGLEVGLRLVGVDAEPGLVGGAARDGVHVGRNAVEHVVGDHGQGAVPEHVAPPPRSHLAGGRSVEGGDVEPAVGHVGGEPRVGGQLLQLGRVEVREDDGDRQVPQR